MNWIITTAVSERVISPETATEVVTGATIEVEIGAVTEVETGTGVVIEAVIEAEIRVVTGAGKGAGKGAGIEVVIVIDTRGGHDEGVSRALGRHGRHGHIDQKPGQNHDLAQGPPTGLVAVSDRRVR
jgi:hypothetical protein